jgi:peptidoglycan/xylan/chitin deacetylase (PgdA/CDA1 family)
LAGSMMPFAGKLGFQPAYAVNEQACNCVVFRYDDIQDYWISATQRAVMDKFIEKNQKVSLGVVLNFIGNDPNIINKVEQGLAAELFELDIHGWNHVDYTGLSLEDQENTLFSAVQKLDNVFGVSTPVFIMPYNKFNEDTLTAMNNNGLSVISSEFDLDSYPIYHADGTGSDIKDVHGIYHLPQATTFADHTGGVITYLPQSVILSDVSDAISTYGYAVITIHPQDFRLVEGGVPTSNPDPQRLAELESLIDALLAQNYEIVNFQDVLGLQQQQFIDTIAPTIIAPADVAQVSSGTLTPVTLGSPTVSDNVTPVGSIVVGNDAPAAGFPIGTTIVTWNATDLAGNTAYATQSVTVLQTADTRVPNVAVTFPIKNAQFSGPNSGITVYVSGVATDNEVLGGTQVNSVSPTSAATSKTSAISGITVTTKETVTGTIIVRQNITLSNPTTTTISAGVPVKTTAAQSGLTLGTITASISPGSTAARTHILTINIPFTTNGAITARNIGVISTPLTLGSAQATVVATAVGSPILTVTSGNPGGSGIKDVEVRTTTTSYKKANPVAEHDWSSWHYALLVTPSMVDGTGKTTITAKASDYFGNLRWYNVVVQFTFAPGTDASPPTILSPPPRTVEASGTLTNVTLGFPTVSDNVSPPGSIVVTNNAPAHGFPVGITNVVWTATDAAGNSATATQKITVRDINDPSINAPDDIYAHSTGSSTFVDLGSPAVSDTVDANPVVTNNAPAGSFFPTATTVVTWTATDASGNSATDTQLVVISDDNVPPSVTAPADITIEATGTFTPVSLGNPIVSDNIDPNPFVFNNAPSGTEGVAFPIGTTIVTWTAADHFGNFASADQSVTILETLAPSIIPPPDRTVLATGLSTQVFLGNPKVSDSSDDNPMVTNNVTSAPDHIVSLPIGTTTVNWTATDSSGNSASAIQTITVSDRPVILVFDDGYKDNFVTAKPILDQYGFKATFFIVTGFVGRGSDIMTWNDLVILNGTGHDIESHTINHLNYDNLTLAEAIYEVRQPQVELADHGFNARIFTSPFNSGEHNKTLVQEIAKYYDLGRLGVEPTMFLHCDGWDNSITNQTDCRTFDENGNPNFASRYQIKGWSHNEFDTLPDTNEIYQIFVNEVNAPTLNQNGQYLEVPIVYYHRIDDNIVDSATKVQVFADEMQYLHDNDFVVLTMNDLAYDNNTNFLYIKDQPLLDTVGPFIQAPADKGVVRTGTLTPVALGNPIVGDNRDLIANLNVTNNAPAGGFPVGTTIVTWTVTDFSGNSATATQKVVVVNNVDAADPTVSITTPVSGASIVGTPRAVKVTVTGTASDAQSGIAKVEVRTDAPADIPYMPATPVAPGDWSSWTISHYVRIEGPETLIARATDLFGNVMTTSIPIDVVFTPDVIAPTITAPANITNFVATGPLTSVALGTPIFSDDTDPAPVVTNNAPAGGFPLGTTLVTWTVTDASNNSASDVQSVTIVDTVKPIVTVTSPANNAVVTGPSGAVPVTFTGTASDANSGVQKVELKSGSGSYALATPNAPGDWSTWSMGMIFATQGQHTITVRVTDNAGNVQLSTMKVNIAFGTDSTKPVISITSPLNGAVISGPVSGVVVLITGTASDANSGLSTVEVKLGSGGYKSATPNAPGDWSTWSRQISITSSGTYTVIARATDNVGNQQWAVVTFTVNLGGGP